MTPTQLEQSLNQLISNGEQTPIMIEGPPGIGKSSVVYQVADRLGLKVIDLRLGQIPPSDIRGLPMVKDGISMYACPEWLPKDGNGILFLDELTNAAPPSKASPSSSCWIAVSASTSLEMAGL